ncbi:extracellular solute-binding protein [Paenibacillus contaminans]|uniref:extracellular solute-binding protein n=1 Tax=Paenibacillus contaminans TaxID=450362 RepID=UPI00131418AE|nr:extracellular solute-binding protein [Paenibacillus contaminans]
MRQKMKKWGLSTASLLLVASVTACGSNDPNPTSSAKPVNKSSPDASPSNVYPENGLPKDQKVTLKFGYWENGNGREWIDYAMDTFKKKFPNVSFDTTYSPKIDTITNTKITAGNDDDMFDIFSTSLPRGMAQSLVEAGKIEPQDDLWEHKAYDKGKTLKELQSGVYEAAATISGKMYAVPFAQSVTGLFYNKTLFETNGWNQNPKTWKEFTDLVDTIKAAGVIPITYPGKYPDYIRFAFGVPKQLELAEINGNLKAVETLYRNYELPFYTSPESLEVYKRIYELGQKKAFPDGVAALTHTQSQMQLLQGQAALASTGEWVQNEMKDSIPDGFKWGFMLAPMGDKPESTKYYQSYANGGHHIWAAKPDLNKKWAKEFIVWMWNLDIQQRLAEKAGSLPVRSDFMSEAALVEKLQDAPKAVLQYMKNNAIKGTSTARSVTRSDPDATNAEKLMLDSINDIASGKLDAQLKLKEAEELLKKSIGAKK